MFSDHISNLGGVGFFFFFFPGRRSDVSTSVAETQQETNCGQFQTSSVCTVLQ